ncbi:hypothetical protein DY000_02008531 [Brassica cretica]|uniref:Uncharacterized protein n=1 Tax=Brassica cretica TaxID=69181 RepID=A0ABQ7BYW9_BRACR|nr:hypothetical protein DY000_02008531 [Brassica cretica]
MHGLMSYRCFGRARSLRSDRAEHAFGRCVTILLELLSDVSRFFRKVNLLASNLHLIESKLYLCFWGQLLKAWYGPGHHSLRTSGLDLLDFKVLMKIGIPQACTAKACASRGSGLGSTSRDRIPRGPVPPRPALNVYRGGAGQVGSVQPTCHH